MEDHQRALATLGIVDLRPAGWNGTCTQTGPTADCLRFEVIRETGWLRATQAGLKFMQRESVRFLIGNGLGHHEFGSG